MALRWRAARRPRTGIGRRLLGVLLVAGGGPLWVVAALWFPPINAAIGVVLGGALVAAGVALILTAL